MQPSLAILSFSRRRAPLVLHFVFCLFGVLCWWGAVQRSSAQSLSAGGPQPSAATPGFALLDEAGGATPPLTSAGAALEPMALPDLPVPHPSLNLELAPLPAQAPAAAPDLHNTQSLRPSSQDSAPAIDTGATLAEENADFGTLSINGVDVGQAWTTFQGLMPRASNLNATEAPIVDPSSPDYRVDAGPYNWRGLLAQSLFFNVVENTVRAASDDQIRTLLAHKPFWHDYIASTKQFNMRRWNDGDDFLVNYVGHPMQGAVTGFIEIQNDPRGRQLEIGASPEYWKSRFHAFLWSVAYSTHSEISFLGEAGIGNEGGWTYPIKCKTPGCPQWKPGWHYTNNTGWVDFTITPTVGMLWLFAEDTLDRFVSDRFQGGDRFNLGLAFMRAALNPSRSMANAMRFKSPWYRDFQHDPELENSLMVHSLPSEEDIAAAGRFRRFAIAPYFHAMPFGSSAQPCTLCFGGAGLGFDADYALTRWLSASFAIESQSGLLQKGSTAAGSTRSIGYGLRFGYDGRNDALSLAVRPGIVTDEVVQPMRLDQQHNTYVHPVVENDHSAVTLLLTNDYKLNNTVALRSSIGDTIVRYKNPIQEPPGIGKPPYLSWMSKDDFSNKSNWTCETGPVIRF